MQIAINRKSMANKKKQKKHDSKYFFPTYWFSAYSSWNNSFT